MLKLTELTESNASSAYMHMHILGDIGILS